MLVFYHNNNCRVLLQISVGISVTFDNAQTDTTTFIRSNLFCNPETFAYTEIFTPYQTPCIQLSQE